MPSTTAPTDFHTNVVFPDDVPTVHFETISLQKLQRREPHEAARLFAACKDKGFFYLELGGDPNGKVILNSAEEAIRKFEPFFHQTVDEKKAFGLDFTNGGGYKWPAMSKADDKGNLDAVENFNIVKSDMCLGQTTREWPDDVLQAKAFYSDYIRAGHAIGMLVLECLAQQMGVDPQELLSKHRFEAPSGDHVRLIRVEPQSPTAGEDLKVCFPPHTDFGTVTILMNWLGGLQLFSQSAHVVQSKGWGADATMHQQGEWQWAKPKAGCAIVNLGDSAVVFSNGILCSGRHRVVPPPGKQRGYTRYSVAYFVRPEHDVIMTNVAGTGALGEGQEAGITHKEWVRRKMHAATAGVRSVKMVDDASAKA